MKVMNVGKSVVLIQNAGMVGTYWYKKDSTLATHGRDVLIEKKRHF